MANLTDLCRQLRLAHIAEYIGSQQDEGLRRNSSWLQNWTADGEQNSGNWCSKPGSPI